MHLAVRYRQKKLVSRILDLGADANVTNDAPATGSLHLLGYRPLHIAARDCFDEDMVQLLLSHGAEVNGKTILTEETPLFAVADPRRHSPPKTPSEVVAMARFLMEHGAEIDVCNARGETPLFTAVMSSNLELATFLVERGASLTTRPDTGRTLLETVACKGNVSAIEWLLQHGADPAEVNSVGSTALHMAAHHGKLESVRALLAHPTAELRVQNKEYKSPYGMALTWKSAAQSKTFRKQADIDAAVEMCEILWHATYPDEYDYRTVPT